MSRTEVRRATGPRTLDGKLASSRNALKHGLTARGLLPDECAAEFDAFAKAMRAELGPVGPIEGFLADRIVMTSWRLRRVPRVEAGFLTSGYVRELAERAEKEVSLCEYALDDWTPDHRCSRSRRRSRPAD